MSVPIGAADVRRHVLLYAAYILLSGMFPVQAVTIVCLRWVDRAFLASRSRLLPTDNHTLASFPTCIARPIHLPNASRATLKECASKSHDHLCSLYKQNATKVTINLNHDGCSTHTRRPSAARAHPPSAPDQRPALCAEDLQTLEVAIETSPKLQQALFLNPKQVTGHLRSKNVSLNPLISRNAPLDDVEAAEVRLLGEQNVFLWSFQLSLGPHDLPLEASCHDMLVRSLRRGRVRPME